MVVFGNPAALGLLLLLPIAWFLSRIAFGRRGSVPFPLSQWKGIAFPEALSFRPVLAAVAKILFWTGYVLVVFAVADLSRVRNDTLWLERGDDFLFVLDTSPSMAALDFPESRFGHAKKLILDFAAARPGDSFGLVLFGKDAVLACPPTRDRAFFESKLDAAEIAAYGDGTAIGLGTALAAMHLERTKAPQARIIVLSDGENNAGSIAPETAFDLVTGGGIGLWIIGIGREGEFAVSYRDPATGKTISGTYRSAYDPAALSRMASSAGAAFIEARDESTLKAAFAELGSRTARNVKSRKTSSRESWSAPFLSAGIAVAALAAFLKRFLLGEAA